MTERKGEPSDPESEEPPDDQVGSPEGDTPAPYKSLFSDAEIQREVGRPRFRRQLVRGYLVHLTRDYLFPFARRVFADGAEPLEWPGGRHLQHLAWQLQEALNALGGQVVITMPPTPARALLTLSILPAWLAMQEAGAPDVLCIARTTTLAREYARRNKALLRSPWPRFMIQRLRERLDPDSQPPRYLGKAVWGAAMGDVAPRPLDAIMLCDPLASEDQADTALGRDLLRWLTDLAEASAREEGMPATVVVAEPRAKGNLADVLIGAGFTQINIPAVVMAPLSLAVSPYKTMTYPLLERLLPPRLVSYELARIREAMKPAAFEALYS